MRIAIVSALMLGLLQTSAMAQKGPSDRSAASLECSKQADAQGVHGKKRKTFRKHCMREMRKR